MSHEELMHFDGEAPAAAMDGGSPEISQTPVDAQELVEGLLRWRDELTDSAGAAADRRLRAADLAAAGERRRQRYRRGPR